MSTTNPRKYQRSQLHVERCGVRFAWPSRLLVAFKVTFPQMQIWWIGAAIIFVTNLFLAYLSWVYVEGPALSKKKAVSEWVHRRIGWFKPSVAQKTNPGLS